MAIVCKLVEALGNEGVAVACEQVIVFVLVFLRANVKRIIPRDCRSTLGVLVGLPACVARQIRWKAALCSDYKITNK
ncbi:hypothetical protein MA16_Dca024213 [Dendrobium catenatum]|uniref:Uncharacterized protein n=1 Tax=Dendrobium catenatum TaxID=906689 RepID=A0A2I0VHA3_9ASPA|nr:hypothetical protein MA16_Dca024213 [Dendrobium catenatum]